MLFVAHQLELFVSSEWLRSCPSGLRRSTSGGSHTFQLTPLPPNTHRISSGIGRYRSMGAAIHVLAHIA